MTTGARNAAIALALAAAAVAGPVVMSTRYEATRERAPVRVRQGDSATRPAESQPPQSPSNTGAPPDDRRPLKRFPVPYYVVRDTGDDLVLVPQRAQLASTGTPGQWRTAHTALHLMQDFQGAEGLQSPFPPGGHVIGVQVLNGLATVNLAESFRENFSGGAREEQMTIYAVVNAIGSIPGITGVTFQVQGRPIEEFAGHLDLSEPLVPDRSLEEPSS